MPFDRHDSAADDCADAQPQYFLVPGSGTAPNGLPYFNWDQAALQLAREGASWTGSFGQAANVTYAFRASGTPPSGMGISQFAQFNEAQIIAAERALQFWAEVCNITFTRVGSGTTGPQAYSNDATILFANFVNGPGTFSAFAYLPDPTKIGAAFEEGDVWVNVSRDYDANPLAFPLGARILLHEIGHTLGFLHPSNYDGGAGSGLTYAADADYYQDTHQFTVQSYFDETNTGAYFGGSGIVPMMHDIAAAQLIYGANMTTRAGSTTYGFNSNAGNAAFAITSASDRPVFCIWDAGGVDTLDLSGFTTGSQIDLRQESFSSAGRDGAGVALIGNISIARGAVIENAIGGSGNDTITGNDAANALIGNAGNDTLNGGSGHDHLTGGVGIDALNGGDGFDYARYDNAAARVVADTELGGAAGEGAGDTFTGIEGIVGSAFDDFLSGGEAANDIHGMNGNDVIQGRGGHDYLGGEGGHDHLNGGAGQDVLDGGDGFDYARYDDAAARVVADTVLGGAAGEGAGDTYISIEGIVGSAFNDFLSGGAGENDIHGNDGNDVIQGRGGNDYLGGEGGTDHLNGGTGADTLDGGAGFDYVRYDDATAGVTVNLTSGGTGGEAAGDVYIGVESVIGSAHNDTLIGTSGVNDMYGGAGADTMAGAGGADALSGEAGADRLDGGGGADALYGGADNDVFVFVAGQGNGDSVADFDGLGAGAGDRFEFSGYGTAAAGATFIQLDATHWQITSADGSIVDVITIANSASIHASDYTFI